MGVHHQASARPPPPTHTIAPQPFTSSPPHAPCRLMDNLGLSAEELTPQDVREPESVLPKPALPPFNGYGTLQVGCASTG